MDRLLCRNAEQELLRGIEGEYRRGRRRMDWWRSLATLGAALLLFVLAIRLAAPSAACDAVSPHTSAAEVCGKVTEVLTRQ